MSSTIGRIPSQQDISRLPDMFATAYALRCARRVAPLIPREWPGAPGAYIREVSTQLQLVENMITAPSDRYHTSFRRHHSLTSTGGRGPGRSRVIAEVIDRALDAADNAIRPFFPYSSVFSNEEDAWAASYDDGAMDGVWRAECFHSATMAGELTGSILGNPAAIWTDYELLLTTAEDTTRMGRQWVVPQSIFALHSVFDTDQDIGLYVEPKTTIITVASALNAQLLDYFRHDPMRLYSVSPREFEELIAHLLDGFGLTVELTAKTRDGGRDIVAIQHHLVKMKYLIECKRYAPDRRVEVGVVRALHGVVEDEEASKGIIVTTAPAFTDAASQHLLRHQWRLEGRAFNGIVDWLEDYQRFVMQGCAEIWRPAKQ